MEGCLLSYGPPLSRRHVLNGVLGLQQRLATLDAAMARYVGVNDAQDAIEAAYETKMMANTRFAAGDFSRAIALYHEARASFSPAECQYASQST